MRLHFVFLIFIFVMTFENKTMTEITENTVCALVVVTLEFLTGMIVILLPQALSSLKSDVTSK